MRAEVKVANAPWGTEVSLDGWRIDNLVNVEFEHHVGEMPRLVLHLRVGESLFVGEVDPVFVIAGRRFVLEEACHQP